MKLTVCIMASMVAITAPALAQDPAAQTAPAPAAIERARAELRDTGCCFAIGEWQSGINAVAVPFVSITGEGVFVMSCGGPVGLLPEAGLRTQVAPALRAAIAGLAGACA